MPDPSTLADLRARPDAEHIDVFAGGTWVPLSDMPHASQHEAVEWRMHHGGPPVALPEPRQDDATVAEMSVEFLLDMAEAIEGHAAALRIVAAALRDAP